MVLMNLLQGSNSGTDIENGLMATERKAMGCKPRVALTYIQYHV